MAGIAKPERIVFHAESRRRSFCPCRQRRTDGEAGQAIAIRRRKRASPIAERKEARLNIGKRTHADSSLLQMNCLTRWQILSSSRTRRRNRRTSPRQSAVWLYRKVENRASVPASRESANIHELVRRLRQSEAKRGIDPIMTREMVMPPNHLAVSPPAYPIQAPNARGTVPAKSRMVVINPPITATRCACLE